MRNSENEVTPVNSRRMFMLQAGTIIAGASLLTACNDDDNGGTPTPMAPGDVNLGTGDVGVLNYAYALEQLEAAFYVAVCDNAAFNSIFNQMERDGLQQIRDHEVIHREFFKQALGGSAIANLDFNFSAVNFGDKMSVLNTAKAFEDLGVSAYNGAGQLLTDAGFLLTAGKIVSIEARHASWIRYILSPRTNSFANSEVIDNNGLEISKTPAQVLTTAGPFVRNRIVFSGLPTS